MYKIYLDDLRTPVNTEWIVVRSYDEFVAKVKEIGLGNIEVVTLDHDLGDTAVKEYFNNTSKNYTLNYENIEEKTGYDAAKWMVDWFLRSKIRITIVRKHFPFLRFILILQTRLGLETF
jgi:hypothetical protein